MTNPPRTYSPEELSVRYARYAETYGFTGHEHYTGLKVINMNGRLYDFSSKIKTIFKLQKTRQTPRLLCETYAKKHYFLTSISFNR